MGLVDRFTLPIIRVNPYSVVSNSAFGASLLYAYILDRGPCVTLRQQDHSLEFDTISDESGKQGGQEVGRGERCLLHSSIILRPVQGEG
jgi:hypothetical protein